MVMSTGKKYCKPKITAVELCPDQAILATCQVGGVYLLVANGACVFGVLSMFVCGSTPKGATGSFGKGSFANASATPS